MGAVSFCRMGNVLRREKREQVIALGQLGWTLRHIEEATGVRRETVGEYLRKAGVAIRPVGSWGEKVAFKTGHSSNHRLFGGKDSGSAHGKRQ
jgi:hypothetical protein